MASECSIVVGFEVADGACEVAGGSDVSGDARTASATMTTTEGTTKMTGGGDPVCEDGLAYDALVDGTEDVAEVANVVSMSHVVQKVFLATEG